MVRLLNIACWLGIALLGTYFLGPNGFILAVFVVAGTGAIHQILSRRHFQRILAKIDREDARCVRFDGNLVQGQAAIDIGTAQGWIAEKLPQDHAKKLTVRFEPSGTASSANDFVTALFKAGLARRIAL
ncbi:hypothetical protein QUC32_05050 [Novosphingobium resinovorum]|uniref:hypothetical protein n=1 Tax=Novosphingobium TaxID=165696 RepID=UPI001B3C6D15|nr:MULTISPECIES: hypothetical protein [Novosphingobium]MBF7014998.1 hypothetical protein [Novosphingobium sp. HR1a]WJM24531.1 hypothetical protein QUC32_05050 [Novosphingobium resinovorum]